VQPKQSPPGKAAWPAAPAALLLGMLLAVAAVGIVLSLSAPGVVSGLPQVPEVLAAASQVRDRLRVETGGLRLESALLGTNQAGEPFSATHLELARRADSLLARVPASGRDIVRVTSARASLSLARRDYEAAIRGYRSAVGRAPGYGEARLGLGVALALHAEAQADSRKHRATQLRALAQFANVDESDPAFQAALYNRTLMLARVGRHDEARRFRAEYEKIDGGSVWTATLDRELASR